LAFEKRYKGIGCQVCKVLSRTVCGRGQQQKSPEKIKSVGFVSGARLCHEHKRAQLRIIFSLRKRMAGESTKCSIAFECYNLNQARTRTLSVLSGPRPGRAETLGPGPGPCRPLGQGSRTIGYRPNYRPEISPNCSLISVREHQNISNVVVTMYSLQPYCNVGSQTGVE
jgi:hypothetical protein